MQFAPRAARRPSENIVPLINVVFLLLIFFMLTGTLSPVPPIDVDLPTAAGGSPSAGAPVLVVSHTGTLALDGNPISPDDLSARLGERPGALEVRADARVPARILLPLLERLQQAGLERVDLVTRREP